MKIIFIDHWGVMCLADKHGRINKPGDLPRVEEIRIMNGYDNFDPGAIEILNSILDTDSTIEIVISSDWNRFGDIYKIREFYKEQGIKKMPLDFIPTFYKLDIIKRRIEGIKMWLINNIVQKWVAVDDLYMPELENFVWVSRTDEGIKEQGIKEQILEKLK